MNPDRFELHLPVTDLAERAAARLARETSLSKRALKEVMHKGAVWLTRGRNTTRLRRASAELRPGDELHLYYDPAVLAAEPPPARLLEDFGGYSAWFKPAGMFSQGSKWGDHCTILRWSEEHLRPQRSAFVIHRLDRATQGLMLLAHTKAAATGLSRAFREREVEKRYRALVAGRFPVGGEPRLIEALVDERPARSHVLGLSAQGDRTWVEVRIETGRKHQIRRHLSEIGFPIVGDRLYGGAGPGDPDLALTSVSLAFPCPLQGTPRQLTLPPELLPG